MNNLMTILNADEEYVTALLNTITSSDKMCIVAHDTLGTFHIVGPSATISTEVHTRLSDKADFEVLTLTEAEIDDYTVLNTTTYADAQELL